MRDYYYICENCNKDFDEPDSVWIDDPGDYPSRAGGYRSRIEEFVCPYCNSKNYYMKYDDEE